jgi:protein TonB
MSYAQRKELSGNRTISIIFTAFVVGGLMYAIVTGLAYNVIKKTAQDLKTFDVEEQPPPPEKPPPPPKDMPKVPPPPMVPPSMVRVNLAPPTIQTVTTPVIPPMQPPVITPPPRPQPPPPPRQSQARSLTGSLQGLISSDDYPPSALDNNEQGSVTVSLTIGPSGRVTGCSSSGSASATLKSATCRIVSARARFSPAQDANGNPTTSEYSQTIVWRIAE